MGERHIGHLDWIVYQSLTHSMWKWWLHLRVVTLLESVSRQIGHTNSTGTVSVTENTGR